MDKLKNYILTYGNAKDTSVLKVDSFLNHQIDVTLMEEIGDDFAQYFQHKKITKVLTIETSGIAPAMMVALKLKVPLVFLKKNVSKIHNQDLYTTKVHSFTKDIDYELSCNALFLSNEDHVLFIDDFLANGEACLGAMRILDQAQATLEGVGIVIEKSFQKGRSLIEEKNIDIYSLARIQKLDGEAIEFL